MTAQAPTGSGDAAESKPADVAVVSTDLEITSSESLPGSSPRRFLFGDVAVVGSLIVANFLITQVIGTSFVFVWPLMLVYSMAAAGTNMTIGWTGRISFGHALFLASGAYVAAKLAGDQHLFLGAITAPLICGVCAAGLSVPLSLVAHKRRGVYFTVLTLIVAQIVYALVQNWNYVGGGSGLLNVNVQPLGPVHFAIGSSFSWYLVTWTAVILVGLRVLYRSPFGLACRAVCDDGLRADMLGVPTSRLFTVSLAVSAFVTGVAGAMLGYDQTTVSPTLFYWTVSGSLVVMCLLGGRRSVLGPVVGAIFYVLVEDQFFQGSTNAGDALLGGAFLVVVLLAPEGLVSLLAYRRLVGEYGRRIVHQARRSGTADGGSGK